MGRTKGKTSTMESYMMTNGKAGESFYSDKMDRHLTALSSHYNRKIITERLITVTTAGKKLVANNITKVTILS